MVSRSLINYYKNIYLLSKDKYNIALNDMNTCFKIYLDFVYEHNSYSELLEKRLSNFLRIVINRYCDMKLCEKQYLDAKGGNI